MRSHTSLWRWVLGAGLIVTPAVYLVPRGGVLWLVVSLGTKAAMLLALALGVRLHRPAHASPWWVLVAGTFLYFVGDGIRYPAQAGFFALSHPSVADAFYLTGYTVVLVGLGMLIHRRSGRPDWGGSLDALIVAGAVGVLWWLFLIDPYIDDTSASEFAKLVSAAYPLTGLLLLTAAVRLAFIPGARNTAAWFLGISLAAQLLADTTYSITLLGGSFSPGSPAFAGWMAAFTFLAAATLHPSMRNLSEPIAELDRPPPRWRVPLIMAVALIPPATLVVDGGRHGHVRLIAGGSAALIVLAMARVSVLIGDVRRAQARLRQTERQYRTLVEQVPSVVYTAEYGESGRWYYVSPRIESMLGFTPEEWLADPDLWYERMVPEDRERAMADDTRSRTSGEPLQSEYRLRARDGRVVWVRDEAEAVLDDEGNRVFHHGILIDITLRRHAEDSVGRLAAELEQRVAERTAELEAANQELREAKDVAERANRAKSEFLSRMSHELRTPLNAILGFGQLLETSALSPDDDESAQQILKGGRHLLDLINEVLDIARIESRSLTLSPEPVSVDDVVREAVDLILPLAAERGIELRLDPSDPSRFVLADRQRLKQVMLNLLANAVKYNREGGSVTVFYHLDLPDHLSIWVSDTGPGIAPEDRERLFLPFDRLDADRGGVEGTGLGLALTKALVEAMHGTIGVESELGRGSAFWVSLPLEDAPDAGTAREAPSEPLVAGSLQVRTVLCIEQHPSDLTLMERLLANRPGVKLLTTIQGRMALDLAREHAPDLIVLDVDLPDISGEEVVRRLRGDPATRKTPVIVTSADCTEGQMRRLFAAGANEYLTKPLDVQRFLETVGEALGAAPKLEVEEHVVGGPVSA